MQRRCFSARSRPQGASSPPHLPPTLSCLHHHQVPCASCASSAQLGACHLEGLCRWGAGGSCRTVPQAWRSQLGLPKGSTTLLILLQRPGQWASWALAPLPPGPWQMCSVCKQETGKGGLLEQETVRAPCTEVIHLFTHCTNIYVPPTHWALCLALALAHTGLAWVGTANGFTGREPRG